MSNAMLKMSISNYLVLNIIGKFETFLQDDAEFIFLFYFIFFIIIIISFI